MAEHSTLTDPYLHEVKGASSAAYGQILTANGSGKAIFVTPSFSTVAVGWYDYNDTATTTTPIALTTANTYYDLTNNTLGANTQRAYGISGVTDIWSSGTSRFDWSQLDIGDTIDMRVDLSYTTTSTNTAIDLALEMGVGQTGAFLIPFIVGQNIKTASTTRVIGQRSFYLGSTLTRDNPSRLRVKADGTGSSVIVNGWFTRVIKRN